MGECHLSDRVGHTMASTHWRQQMEEISQDKTWSSLEGTDKLELDKERKEDLGVNWEEKQNK